MKDYFKILVYILIFKKIDELPRGLMVAVGVFLWGLLVAMRWCVYQLINH